MPEAVAAELEAIETALDEIEVSTRVFRASDVARAGVSLTVAIDGSLRAERGFVRPEDDASEETAHAVRSGDGRGSSEGAEPQAPALSAALLTELAAHRTAGLQAALAGQSELALRVLLHGLATDGFYGGYGETVTRVSLRCTACPGIEDSPARQALIAAEAAWRSRLPNDHAALWDWLQEQDMAALLEKR